jgi:DNA polymerase-3 subunit epsilon
MNHSIIRVERDANKSTMWRCKTSKNETINVFDNQLRLFNDYPELAEMQPGGVLHWRTNAIAIDAFEKNGYQNVSLVLPRPDGAVPDQPLTPDHKLSYARAIRWARFVTNDRLNVVTWDTETTGLDATMDEVISIGIVDCNGQVLLDTLIRPSNMAALTATNASEVNGITADMLVDAPTFPDIYGELKAFMDARFWLGYNIQFDARMLDATCLRYDLPPLLSVGQHDATPFVADFVGQWDEAKGGYKYWKLAEAAEKFGLTEFAAHHAAADAVATYEVVKRMSEANAE